MSIRISKKAAVLATGSAAVLGGGVLSSQQSADAAIVYSGAVNILIPVTTSGVYLNVVTGVNSATPASAPNWDINPWGTGSFFLYGAGTGNGFINNLTGGSSTTAIDNLPAGTVIGAGNTYGSSSTETSGATAFLVNSSSNLGGFKFTDEVTGLTEYGWARFSLGATPITAGRSIVEYAYENTGASIAAGATAPEPTSLGLLAVGAAGLMARRNRAAAEVA